MEHGRRKEREISRKKGKNCGLAFLTVIVILLVVILQNLSLYAKAPEKIELTGDFELMREEEMQPQTEVKAEPEAEPQETKEHPEAKPADTKEVAETEEYAEPEMSIRTEDAEGAEKPEQTEVKAEPETPAPTSGDNGTAEEQDDKEALEEAVSENNFTLKMVDENIVVQEETITSNSISCNLISLQKTGFLLDGYYYGEIRAMDPTGVFTTEFMELLQKELSGNVLELKPLWIPKTYKVYYGKDDDRDGFPDGQMLVTYGERYEDLTPLPDRGLSVFKGYYFGSKQVFNRKGKAKESWMIDSDEDIILKAKYYRPEGNDLYGDKDGDKDASSRENTENNTPQTTKDAGDSQKSEILKEQESSKELELNSNTTENTAGNITNNAEENTGIDLSENAVGSEEDIAVGSAAENEGENTEHKPSEPAGNHTAGNPDKFASDNTANPADVRGEETENQSVTLYQSKEAGNALHLQEGDKEENTAGNHRDKDLAKETEKSTEIPEENTNTNSEGNIAELPFQNEAGKDYKKAVNPVVFRDNYRKWKVNAKNYLEEKGISKEVLKISAYMVTSSIILAALFLCFYLIQNSAVLYTNSMKGKRKRIAFILLQKKQEGYQLSISKQQLSESETGNYILSLPWHVVRSKKNARLLISIPNKKWCELPAKEISFLA